MKKRHVLALFAALTVLLTAGTAQSLSGSNTVDSGDIIDGQVKYVDLKNDAVRSKKIQDNAVTAPKLADKSVDSAAIVDGTITDADAGFVNKSTVTLDFAAFPADTCQTKTISSGSFTSRANDVVMVTAPANWPEAVWMHTQNSSSPNPAPFGSSAVSLVVCSPVALGALDDMEFDIVTFP